eukprot:TRINITY_DN12128_c0_g1_i1.p1 TRINITY_DN12128_c0_g1~~TRINITY_DN12128_c0_g1_i1.p1  ORF type:complete len:259 (+),score=65.66 TRINITY_DN12128_c0_g1_i1:56-778(+)
MSGAGGGYKAADAPTAAQAASGKLAPITAQFVEAGSKATEDKLTEPLDLKREVLIDSLDAFAAALDSLGGGMGTYLTANTKKMRDSKADKNEADYKAWLLSELPTHKANKYKGYVDDSAWMGNLWIGWMMEFFVELLAQVAAGKDTKAAIETAYNGTLYNHHNFFQRTAFWAAAKKLPVRDEFLRLMAGTDKKEMSAGEKTSIEKEMQDFVNVSRPLVTSVLLLNDVVEKRMEKARVSGE